jgi:hypothetical protein
MLRRLHEERPPVSGWIVRQDVARSGVRCGKSASWITAIHAEPGPALDELVAVWPVAVDDVAERGVTDCLPEVRRWADACVLRCV